MVMIVCCLYFDVFLIFVSGKKAIQVNVLKITFELEN